MWLSCLKKIRWSLFVERLSWTRTIVDYWTSLASISTHVSYGTHRTTSSHIGTTISSICWLTWSNIFITNELHRLRNFSKCLAFSNLSVNFLYQLLFHSCVNLVTRITWIFYKCWLGWICFVILILELLFCCFRIVWISYMSLRH